MSEETTAITPQIGDLKPKVKLQGKVKKIELFGAFVDIGVGRDGLVHISQLKRAKINRVDEVVQEGQDVTVWVRRVDPTSGRIELTMIEPAAVEWNEIRLGQVYTGKVARLEKFGAFVDIGAERPGLVHVREMAKGHVNDPGDLVRVGDEVDVKVIGFDTKKRQIDLSMKAVEVVVEEEEQALAEPTATAMELALRKALGGQASRRTGAPEPGRRGPGRRNRAEQEDILARTLRTQPAKRKED